MQLSHRYTQMNAETRADITVVICTRNRAESLRETLTCLARAEVPALHSEIVVVDNGSTDATAEVVHDAPTCRPVHYLFEPHPGKSWALNRALSDAPLGEIVAVLDDDMSPHDDWFKGVKAICDRWPNRDLFTGRSYVIWPRSAVPDWCLDPRLRGWAYSVMGNCEHDAQLRDGRWFSGNHFWFRSRVLADGRKFEKSVGSLETHIEMAEPQFMFKLVEDGYKGIMAPDAVCGHRIQLELLQLDHMKQRARRVGRGYAVARMCPYKSRLKQARLFRAHPLLGRLYCILSILGWSSLYTVSWLQPVRTERIALQLQAIQRLATYREYLHVAGQMNEYRVFSPHGKT
jgi:glycosyltransferase involved in cell wall biosynthesis